MFYAGFRSAFVCINLSYVQRSLWIYQLRDSPTNDKAQPPSQPWSSNRVNSNSDDFDSNNNEDHRKYTLSLYRSIHRGTGCIRLCRRRGQLWAFSENNQHMQWPSKSRVRMQKNMQCLRGHRFFGYWIISLSWRLYWYIKNIKKYYFNTIKMECLIYQYELYYGKNIELNPYSEILIRMFAK